MKDKKPRILFCERNPQQKEALKYFFDKRGIETYFSGYDGRMVLQDIEGICPHIVVLEVHMPYYDAVGVKAMCEDKPYKPNIFIAHGCYESETVIQNVLNAGYDRYLLRPYAYEILQDAAEKLFGADFSGKANLPFLEYRADEILHRLGMPGHITGYTYLRQGISMALKEPLLLNNLTKDMYPRLAKLNGITASRVERAIRTAIKLTWERGNLQEVNRFFCSGINNVWGKPTNGEFLAIISDHIKNELIKEQLLV